MQNLAVSNVLGGIYLNSIVKSSTRFSWNDQESSACLSHHNEPHHTIATILLEVTDSSELPDDDNEWILLN